MLNTQELRRTRRAHRQGDREFAGEGHREEREGDAGVRARAPRPRAARGVRRAGAGAAQDAREARGAGKARRRTRGAVPAAAFGLGCRPRPSLHAESRGQGSEAHAHHRCCRRLRLIGPSEPNRVASSLVQPTEQSAKPLCDTGNEIFPDRAPKAPHTDIPQRPLCPTACPWTRAAPTMSCRAGARRRHPSERQERKDVEEYCISEGWSSAGRQDGGPQAVRC